MKIDFNINKTHYKSSLAFQKKHETKYEGQKYVPYEVVEQYQKQQGTYNFGAIQIKKTKSEQPYDLYKEKIKTLLKDEINENEEIHSIRLTPQKSRMFAKIGKKYEGFESIFESHKALACYFDKNNDIKKIYLQNLLNDEIDVFDYENNKKRHYSRDEVDALKYYKYHPDWIHTMYRRLTIPVSGGLKDELLKVACDLENIFSNEEKVIRNKTPKTLYRAIESPLPSEDLTKLQTKSSIFEEKSYCSTTTNFEVASKFSHKNPILKIDFPPESPYVDIEELFNIDREHWNEDEILLDKNSKFLVQGFDEDKNLINVRYLGSN